MTYVWTVIWNIFVLFVAANVYTNIYDPFQIKVISLLILIYIAISSMSFYSRISATQSMIYLTQENIKTRGLLGFDEKDTKEEMAEVKSLFDKDKRKFLISSIFNSILSVVALVKLLD